MNLGFLDITALEEPDDRRDMLVSIIVPFHNTGEKSDRLRSVLSQIEDYDVEIVLVDDGSEPRFRVMVSEFAAQLRCRHKVIFQENKGPGGARNAGLMAAVGRYVWFVDSDDVINPDAINVLRSAPDGYDFIDFDMIRPLQGQKSTMPGFAVGPHIATDANRSELFLGYGRLWTKIFSRDFLDRNEIRYPENCIYEDNTLSFVLPFVTEKFLKSDIVGYTYHTDAQSITRVEYGKISPRFFDRLATARSGAEWASRLPAAQTNAVLIHRRFSALFLDRTLNFLEKRGAAVFDAARVIRAYLDTSHDLGIPPRNIQRLAQGNEFVTDAHAIALNLPSQGAYFDELSRQAWPLALRRALCDVGGDCVRG